MVSTRRVKTESVDYAGHPLDEFFGEEDGDDNKGATAAENTPEKPPQSDATFTTPTKASGPPAQALETPTQASGLQSGAMSQVNTFHSTHI